MLIRGFEEGCLASGVRHRDAIAIGRWGQIFSEIYNYWNNSRWGEPSRGLIFVAATPRRERGRLLN